MRRWVAPVLILPGTALVFVPALLLLLTRGTARAAAPASPGEARFWIAVLLALPGVGLSAWTASLFFRFGEGTPAPWDPPRKLILRGPYRYLRNPMISGVFALLAAESLYFGSWAILAWLVAFWAGNLLYIPRVEEMRLAARFGEAYAAYKESVPRWIPRLQPWEPE